MARLLSAAAYMARSSVIGIGLDGQEPPEFCLATPCKRGSQSNLLLGGGDLVAISCRDRLFVVSVVLTLRSVAADGAGVRFGGCRLLQLQL